MFLITTKIVINENRKKKLGKRIYVQYIKVKTVVKCVYIIGYIQNIYLQSYSPCETAYNLVVREWGKIKCYCAIFSLG